MSLLLLKAPRSSLPIGLQSQADLQVPAHCGLGPCPSLGLRPDRPQLSHLSTEHRVPPPSGQDCLLSLELRRLLETQSPDVMLGRWVPRGQAERGGPATAPARGTVLHQEPCRVQTNLASPIPCLGLALKTKTGPNRLINASFQQQQSNLQPLCNLPQWGARALAIQQSNLGVGEAGLAERGSRCSPHLWLEPPESFWPHVKPLGSPPPQGPQARPSSTPKQSRLLPTDTLCPDFRPTVRYAPVDGHTGPGPSSWGGLGNWTAGLTGEPLTLEELAVPAKSQARAPSQAAMSQLLGLVRCLERQVARLRCRGAQEPPVPSQQEPWTSNGQGLPACPQPSQPILASWDKRKKHPHRLRGAVNFPGTPGAQLGPSDSQAGSTPTSPPRETTSEVLTEDFLNSELRILPACALRAAQGVLPEQERGAEAPREQVSRETSCLPATAPARSTLQNKAQNIVSLEWETACWQLLSRCFRAWQCVVWRRWAVAAAVARGQRQLLCRGPQALRWALWLQEAQLEAAWGQHARALLARSFQKWRNLTQQHKQQQPYIQAGPGSSPSRGGPSGRKPAVDPMQRSR